MLIFLFLPDKIRMFYEQKIILLRGFCMFGKRKQMSESMLIAILLALSGGFIDAYSFNSRGEVFANAQTGNLVMLSQSLARKDPHQLIKYILPVMAFFIGVYFTEIIRIYCQQYKILHWRQIVALMEVFILILVGIMSTHLDYIANATMSMTCAMQFQSFRKFHGVSMPTIICTGNLRSATELLSLYHFTRDDNVAKKSLYYYGVVAMFGLGAAIGAISSDLFGLKAIWVNAALMFFGFILMFKEETTL